MRTVQLMKKMSDASKNVFRVYHIRIIAKTKIGSRMYACLPQHPWLFIFSSWGHDRQSLDQSFSSQGHDQQSSEQSNRKLISFHNNGKDDKHAHGFADF